VSTTSPDYRHQTNPYDLRDRGRWLDHLSHRIGYRYHRADEDALVGVLDDTDDESLTAWFQYPLQGTPPVLQARIDTMLSLL